MTNTLPGTGGPRQATKPRRTELIRYERMIGVLRLFIRVALGAALVGLLLPGPVGRAASATAVTVVIAAPLIRVAWLAVRWYSRGDRRYAAVAAALLLIVGVGSVLAFVTR